MPSLAPPACRALDRVMRRRETPVVVCVDVEPDACMVDGDDHDSWLGFERLLERTPHLRSRLATATATGAPVAFTWFLRMDPQVADAWGSAGWVAETYRAELAALTESGDELALHPHTYR